jgi:hypothetical protein
MSKLFQLPSPASSNAKSLQPAPEDARERDDAIAAVVVATPGAVERSEQELLVARDFTARTTTIRRAGYMRGFRWGLGAALAVLAFGPAGGIAVAAIAEVVR